MRTNPENPNNRQLVPSITLAEHDARQVTEPEFVPTLTQHRLLHAADRVEAIIGRLGLGGIVARRQTVEALQHIARDIRHEATK